MDPPYDRLGGADGAAAVVDTCDDRGLADVESNGCVEGAATHAFSAHRTVRLEIIAGGCGEDGGRETGQSLEAAVPNR